MITTQKLARTLNLLCVTYGKKIQPDELRELTTAWAMSLDGFTDEEIQHGAIKLMRVHKGYMPTPADLIDCIPGAQSTEERANEQWGILIDAIERVGCYSSIDFENGYLTEFVQNQGGWRQVCNLTYDELKWQKKTFVENYRVDKEQINLGVLPGSHKTPPAFISSEREIKSPPLEYKAPAPQISYNTPQDQKKSKEVLGKLYQLFKEKDFETKEA